MNITQIITERYVNLIGSNPKKEKYKQAVYDIIVHSYKSIGGSTTGGTESPDALLSIPFWKLAVKDGRVVAVILYKDKNGRKTVASGTDGSLAGKKAMIDMVKSDPERSYSEKSKSALNLFMKSFKNPETKLIEPEKAAKILKTDIMPISDFSNPTEWPLSDKEREAAQLTLSKYPVLYNYAYIRAFGDNNLLKVMVGTPEKPIK